MKDKFIKFLLFLVISLIMPVTVVISQAAKHLILTSSFEKGFIGPVSSHRTGGSFKNYSDTSAEWSKLQNTSCWLSPGDVHWLYCEIENRDTIDKTIKLYLNNVQAGITLLYSFKNGKLDSLGATGSLLPLNKRSSGDRSLSIPFLVAANETLNLYVKTSRKEVGITLTPILYDTLKGDMPVWTDNLLLTVLSFIFLIVITALVVLKYFLSKESFWFFLYIFFGFFYVLAASGYGSLYLWSKFPFLEENAAVLLGALSTSAFLEFSRIILNTKRLFPTFNKILLACIVIYPLAACLGFLFYNTSIQGAEYSSLLRIPYLLMPLCFGITLGISIYNVAVKKKREFGWFIGVFSFYFLMVLVLILLETGSIAYNHNIHAVLLSFGALPQMVLTLIFLLHRILKLLEFRNREILSVRLQGQQDLMKERLRVSKDLHDEVGATLSGIAMYSHLTKEQIKIGNALEVTQSLNIMQQSAGEMVDKLNDIVWLVNPTHDSMQELIQRLEEYATDMAHARNMQVKLSVPPGLIEYKMPVESRRSIYLFCKEAINNAVKYSEGTLLELIIIKSGGLMQFNVTDNGKGFDPATVQRGNGLENMQRRADDIGAKLQMNSVRDKGCSVSLQVKIN
ncbi:MAG: 7TM diverse intracellular signaling domain-containing protein [Bacteroidota bacterium]